MKDWIMELCPEIVGWQAELIAEQAQRRVDDEREACAQIADKYHVPMLDTVADIIAAKIRARGKR